MKIKEFIKELERLQEFHGEYIEVQVQIHRDDFSKTARDHEEIMICGFPEFFIVAEEYDYGQTINLRAWPY